MPRLCESCSHRLRADLDIDLLAGLSQSAVARKYHLSRACIGRHVRGGHVTTVVPASAPVPLDPGATPQDVFRAILTYLHGFDVAGMPVGQRMQVVREQRMAAESLAKHSPVTARVSQAEREVDALKGIVAVYDEVLDAHPEIARELAAAMHSWKAGRGRPTATTAVDPGEVPS